MSNSIVEEKKITENGEITLNEITGIYTVWDETYTDFVAKTKYLEVAKDALSSYAKHYLRGED